MRPSSPLGLPRARTAVAAAVALGVFAVPAVVQAAPQRPGPPVDDHSIDHAAIAEVLDAPRTPPAPYAAPLVASSETTGTPGTRTRRQWTTTATYVDVCAETPGAIDLRRTYVDHDTAVGGVLAFTAESCSGWDPSELSTVAWRLSVPGGRADGPDYVVQVRRDPAGLVAEVLHLPSADPGTWRATEVGVDRPDSRTLVVWAPVGALHGRTSFGFDLVGIDSADRADALPALDRPLVAFPEACTVLTYRYAVLDTDPGRRPQAERSIRAQGLSVAAGRGNRLVVARRGRSLAELAALPGVAGARRLVAFERSVHLGPYGTSAGTQWALERIRAHEGWSSIPASSGRLAAVIDDGVDGTRPELLGRVVAGRDLVAGAPLAAGANSDLGGHGTAVAGVIAADPGESGSVRGVDRGARIVPYRVFDEAGCAAEDDLAAAVDQASARGVDVINLSLGGPDHSDLLADAIGAARAGGAVVVASAGNQRTDGNLTVFPAADPGVVAVGATTRSDAVAGYSQCAPWLDLAAPGGDASGTPGQGILVLAEGGGIAEVAGTSFSSPLVAGAVLLYRERFPTSSAEQVETALRATARDEGLLGPDPFHGAGILDLGRLLPPAAAVTVTAHPQHARGDDPVGVTLTADPSATIRYTTDGSPPTGTSSAYTTPITVSGTAQLRARAFGPSGTPLGPETAGTYVIGPPPTDATLPASGEENEVLGVSAPPAAGRAHTWDFGDGGAASGAAASHAYTDSGPWTITLTATDPSGAWTVLQRGVAIRDGAAVTRSSGPGRIETAAAVAADDWTTATDVVIATAATFPDALSAGALAARRDAPLLLTHRDELPGVTREQLARLGPATIWVLGGPSAISETVAAELTAYGTVRRLGGSNRYETAGAIAREAGRSSWGEVALAFGENFPDAVSAGALAASPDRVPTLLTRQAEVPVETLSALRDLGTTRVLVIGGPAVIAPAVETQLAAEGYEVARLRGPDRYSTSAVVAQDALHRHPFGPTPVAFATGAQFPDALAAAPLAAHRSGILALVDPTTLDAAPATRDLVSRWASLFDRGWVVGGPAAVNDEVLVQLRVAMRDDDA